MHSEFMHPDTVRETEQMDHSDSAATPEEHALEAAIDDFLESGNKAGNYRDALERVLTD